MSNEVEWNGMEWNGMEWNGMEWNGMRMEVIQALSAYHWNGMSIAIDSECTCK
jgi:hypothetical protein